MKTKKILGIALAVCMTIGLTTVPAMAEDKKTFVFGDTTFNAENEEADINPQNTYAGWACIRYGVGEPCSAILIPWKLNHGLPKNMKM